MGDSAGAPKQTWPSAERVPGGLVVPRAELDDMATLEAVPSVELRKCCR